MTGGFNPGFTGQNLYPYGGGPFPGYSQQFPTFPYPQSGSPQQQVPSTSPGSMSSAHYSQQQQGAPFAPYQLQQLQQQQQQTRGQPGGSNGAGAYYPQ